VALAVLASISFGCFYLTMAEASRSDVVWAALIQRGSSVCLLGATALLLRQRPALHRRELPTLATIGILDVGANVLYGAASTIGSIALVPVLASSVYPVEGVVLARLVLHERIAPLQRAAVLVVIAGVALVSA
jgi:drug/metabolite transporter (DMT)-like permease